MSATRVVVVGAGGFIGARVLERLAGHHPVVAVVRRMPERHPGAGARDVQFVPADLGPGWANVLTGNADVVIWLAQSRRYREFPAGAADMFRVNEAALFETLEWAREHGVGRFIYASTGSVYAPAQGPIPESWPAGGSSFYAATKLNGEMLARQYSGCFEVVIGRVFSVYGPGQSGMAVARVVESAAHGRPVSLAGGVGMELTPLYVDDAAEIFAKLVSVPLPANPAILNIAGPEATTLATIASLAANAAGVSVRLVEEAGEAARVAADTRQLRAMLPDMRFRGLADGITATVAALGMAQPGSK